MAVETITDIPEDKVTEVVKDYILSGAKKITLTMQSDGKWTISADLMR